MTTRRIAFLVFGVDEVFTETRYHLLRLLATNDPAEVGVVVYTDQPERFDRWSSTPLQLEVIPTPMSQILEWRGPAQFFWRPKIMMILDALDRFGGSILYCDSDTYPRRRVDAVFERLESGTMVMDTNEGVIDRTVNPKFWHFDKYFRHHPTFSLGDRTFTVPLDTPIWDAGVVGAHSAQRTVVADALEMCDELYSRWPFVHLEQFSLGYMFENSPKGCVAASEAIYHYWAVRRYVLLLERFFARFGNSPLEERIRRSADIAAEKLAPIQRKWEDERPFQFLWERYPYRMKKLFPKQWPIEEQFHLVDQAGSA